MPDHGRLIELQAPRRGEREVTLYVKGFLSRGEKPDRFNAWLACHETLEETHGWGVHALGYQWPSGRFGAIPTAVGLAKGSYDLIRVLRNVRRAASLGHLGYLIGEKLVVASALFVHQYWVATRNAREFADAQAAHLRRLAEAGERVRVVGHSLGCRQVIEATARLAPEHRPHEIHLCAPAVREDEVADKLAGLAREATTLYFTEKDRVLDLGFTPLARGRALGFAGPRGRYSGLTAIDAGDAFDFWVHREYKNRFAQLVPKRAGQRPSVDTGASE